MPRCELCVLLRSPSRLGHAARLRAEIVNYADDFVILCRGDAREACAAMRGMMSRLKLTVNEAKTRVCRVPEETFDFLGYTIGRCCSPRNGRAYLGSRPSAKKVCRVREQISGRTDRRGLGRATGDLMAQLNRLLVGWHNYFRLGHATPAYRAVDMHCRERVRRWLRLKHKVAKGSATRRFPDLYLEGELGLVRLTGRRRDFPCARA